MANTALCANLSGAPGGILVMLHGSGLRFKFLALTIALQQHWTYLWFLVEKVKGTTCEQRKGQDPHDQTRCHACFVVCIDSPNLSDLQKLTRDGRFCRACVDCSQNAHFWVTAHLPHLQLTTARPKSICRSNDAALHSCDTSQALSFTLRHAP